MKFLNFFTGTFMFLLYALGTLAGLFVIFILTWIFGSFASALFGINAIVCYIVFGIGITISVYASLTTPTKSGNYSPLAYIFLGWLIGHK